MSDPYQDALAAIAAALESTPTAEAPRPNWTPTSRLDAARLRNALEQYGSAAWRGARARVAAMARSRATTAATPMGPVVSQMTRRLAASAGSAASVGADAVEGA